MSTDLPPPPPPPAYPPPPPVGGYPAALTGRIDAPSRWMWLVKWLLVIPHIIVLAFLGLAAAVTVFIAWFAILFTGRFPRGMFDFVVGVLRWNWRVYFYASSPAATDKYPPFSLASDPDYPCDFQVAYPERLSRGLIFVKWLLAIPHLIVLYVLSLVANVLTLIALIALLFTGRYPQGIFDFVLGVNRWNYRVSAYIFLLRDEYPPFRLAP